jgi:antitoxin YefM
MEDDFMLAVNYSTIREQLKNYCDKVTDEHETVIVTRKGEKNVVLISLEEWNALQKAAKNAEYLAKIDRAIEQLSDGKGQFHELIEVDEDE